MRNQGEPELGTAIDDAATDRPVVGRADPDLNCRDRREVQGLVQLRTVDIADADSRDQLLVDEPADALASIRASYEGLTRLR